MQTSFMDNGSYPRNPLSLRVIQARRRRQGSGCGSQPLRVHGCAGNGAVAPAQRPAHPIIAAPEVCGNDTASMETTGARESRSVFGAARHAQPSAQRTSGEMSPRCHPGRASPAPRADDLLGGHRKFDEEGGPRGGAGQRYRPAERVDAISQAEKP